MLFSPISVWCEDVSSLMEQGGELFKAQRYEDSLKVFQKVSGEHPGSPQAAEALLMEGMNFERLAEEKKDPAFLDKERDSLLRLIEKYPASSRSSEAYLYLGELHSRLTGPLVRPKFADCSKAIGFYRRAIKKADRDWIKAQAKGRISGCLYALGREQEARAGYDELRRQHPDTPFAKEMDAPYDWGMMDEAVALFKGRRYAKSLALFQKIADDYPGSPAAPEALLMVGINCDWLAKEGKDPAFLEKEKQTLNRLIEKYPGNFRAADAYLYLGQVHSGHTGVAPKLVDYSKAIQLYRKAIEKADREWIKAQALGRIGECLEALGRRAEARSAYEEVLRKYPDTPWAGEVKGFLKSR